MIKRGVSEVISYTLLIFIAISLSIIAFAFLKLYVPKDRPECKEGVSLIIGQAICIINITDETKSLLDVTLQNTGTFKADKAYVRISNIGEKFKEDVNSSFGENPHPLLTGIEEGLNPGMSFRLSLIFPAMIDKTQQKQYILEIQPAHLTEEKDINSLALCPPITETITCKFSIEINDLTAKVKTGKVTLEWIHKGADFYEIYRSEENGPYNKIDTTTSTFSTYLDYSTIAGKKYSYFVRGIFNSIQIDSNQVSVTAI